MRKLIQFNLITLDGYFEGPDHEIDWHNVDHEFNEFAIEQLNTFDALIFGRVTYQLMADYWPTPNAIKDDPVIADKMNSLPKFVISKTLHKADWNNTILIKENVNDEILKLKEQTGKDIAIFGSGKLVDSLTQLGLIDEHRFIINPVILGKGNRIFQHPGSSIKLKLVKSRTFKSGNILLYYQNV